MNDRAALAKLGENVDDGSPATYHGAVQEQAVLVC